jgi:hypothetical protein
LSYCGGKPANITPSEIAERTGRDSPRKNHRMGAKGSGLALTD